MGALTLANSIKQQGSKASRVVLISSDVSADAKAQLSKLFDEVIVVPVFDVKVALPPRMKHQSEKEVEDKNRLFSHAFTKLHALKLTQYEKIALLDADTVCISNPDSIFQVTAPAGICTGVKNDNTQHGKPIDVKVIEKCYKEAGFPGNTYVLRPNMVDWERAIKLLTVKVKITSVQIVQTSGAAALAAQRKKAGGSSAFAGFDDDDDDDDENEEREEQTQQAPREDIVVTTKYLTKEDIAMAKFDDDKVEKKREFPFEIFELPEQAPLGFSYEGRKSNMNQDECLFVDLYLKQWKHLHPRFGLLSWKKNKPVPKNTPETVFLHFTQKAWNVDVLPGQDVSRWADLVYFDLVALDLYKAFANDKDMVAFIRAQYPTVDDKLKQLEEGTLLPQKVEKAEPETTTTTTTTTTTPTTPQPTTPEPEAPKEKQLKAAAVPKQSAWGKKL